MSNEETVHKHLSQDQLTDVADVVDQLRCHLDHMRMQRGKVGQLGYLFIERQHHPDAVLVFDTPETAENALVSHPLVNALCEEDAVDAYVGTNVTLADIAGHEVILP